jgi:redox-sensitive bicupin YhaK (pirin superfamily)
VQVMSAGTGIRHAEYNLEQRPTRIFQIWIVPSQNGGSPAWGSRPFPKGDRSGRFVTLASGFDFRANAAAMRQVVGDLRTSQIEWLARLGAICLSGPHSLRH